MRRKKQPEDKPDQRVRIADLTRLVSSQGSRPRIRVTHWFSPPRDPPSDYYQSGHTLCRHSPEWLDEPVFDPEATPDCRHCLTALEGLEAEERIWQRYPVGSRVRIVKGQNAGRVGVIRRHTQRRVELTVEESTTPRGVFLTAKTVHLPASQLFLPEPGACEALEELAAWASARVPCFHMAEGVHRYLTEGLCTGSFLRALFGNDLEDAAHSADAWNLRALHMWVCWLRDCCPEAAHGSAVKRDRWMRGRGISELQSRLEGWAAQRRFLDDVDPWPQSGAPDGFQTRPLGTPPA